MPDYGKTTIAGTDYVVDSTRAHPIPASTISANETGLISVTVRVRTHRTDQVRVAIYQNDDISNPEGGDLIRDFGLTPDDSGSVNVWITLISGGETIDPSRVTWIGLKGDGSGGGIHYDWPYDTSSATAGDFESSDGRWESSSIAESEDAAWPDPWPNDSGSKSNQWYSAYLTAEAVSPVIDNCVPSITLLPDSTGVVATGSSFGSVQGSSKIQLSDNATYGAGTLVDQSVTTWTDASIDFDIVLGGLTEGDLFLFVVLDPGGAGEDPSNAFLVNVRAPADEVNALPFVTQAGTGIQDVVGFGFEPTSAIMAWTGNTLSNTAQPSVRQGRFTWTPTNSATHTTGKTTGTTTTQRHQRIGEIVIRNAGSATDLAVAVVTALPDGFRFTWSIATAGHSIFIIAFGGTVTAHQRNVLVSQSPVTGVQFPADLIFAAATGQTLYPADSSFGIYTVGVASAAAAANEVHMHMYTGPTSASINAGLSTDAVIEQVNGTTVSWNVNISVIGNDGFSWSDSDSDTFSYLALHFRELGVNVGTFVKDASGTDNVSQSIGSQGYVSKVIVMINAHRTSETISAGDSCNSGGISVSGGFEGSVIVTDNTSNNADQAAHTSGVIRGGTVDAISTAVGTITSFSDNPVIQWTTNDTTAAIIGYLTIESPAFPQDIIQDVAPPTDVVPTQAVSPGAAPPVQQDAFPFVGIVPVHELMAGMAFINTHDDIEGGIVPDPEMILGVALINTYDDIEGGIVPDTEVTLGLALINTVDDIAEGIVEDPAGNVVSLLNNFDDIAEGLLPKHRLVTPVVTLVQDPFDFFGVVPVPTVPTPGVATIIQLDQGVVDIVPSPTILAGAPADIVQDPLPFVGIVPEPALSFGMVQLPLPFVGLVPDPTVVAGTITLIQLPLPFTGIVDVGHEIIVGAAPAIVQDPQLTVDVVPSPNIVSLLNAHDDIENGIVPPPTIVAELAPAIVEDPFPFVGIVPEPSIAMVIGQLPMPFVGIVPRGRGVVLRDAPGRRIRAVESI